MCNLSWRHVFLYKYLHFHTLINCVEFNNFVRESINFLNTWCAHRPPSKFSVVCSWTWVSCATATSCRPWKDYCHLNAKAARAINQNVLTFFVELNHINLNCLLKNVLVIVFNNTSRGIVPFSHELDIWGTKVSVATLKQEQIWFELGQF